MEKMEKKQKTNQSDIQLQNTQEQKVVSSQVSKKETGSKEKKQKPATVKTGVWKKKAKEQTVSIIFFLVIAFVVINSFLLYYRIDMTSNKVYSISPVSLKILEGAEDLVYIDYYVSPRLKLQVDQTQQIFDILQEMSVRSRGNIIVEEIDPETLSETELREKGLEARQMQFIEKNEASFAVVYSGIVISYQDKSLVIPFTVESSIIEYQIVSRVLEAYTDDKRVVGIIPLDPYYAQNSPQGILNTLEQDYEVQIIEPRVLPLPQDLDVLFVLGNQDPSDELAYYIDQHIMQGKGVFFALDRAQVDLANPGLVARSTYTVLNEMLEH